MARFAMQLAIPRFQFRFVPAMGNVIHPGNFHPVGAQVGAERMIDRVLTAMPERPATGSGGNWLIVGGSGGFGSAARAVLGAGFGANTLNLSFDAEPQPDSSNKGRKIGSPGFHRSLALERRLAGLGLTARSLIGDAFDPAVRDATIAAVRERFGGKLHGLVWALAAPRALDPRTGKTVQSVLKPLGRPATIRTFSGRGDGPEDVPRIAEFTIPPGTPEEAVATQYVMGGRIVEQWVLALQAAGVLADGFTLVTISYRGNPLNAAIYRDGLIGLAKADLEFHTRALHEVLKSTIGGRAVAVEGPAVVTEASGGIPGVPLHMAVLLDVMGLDFEDPLVSMLRLFRTRLPPRGSDMVVDEHGLVRMDDLELASAVQDELQARYARLAPGEPFDPRLYQRFMDEYAQTRGFGQIGVDYAAEFDTDAVCRP